MKTILILVLLQIGSAFAADSDNRAAVKGAGMASCQDFVKARNSKNNTYYQFGGWLNGYITAYNQRVNGTFDIASWQNTDLLAGLLEVHCRQKPDALFFYAVNSLLQWMEPARIKQHSESIDIHSQDGELRFYKIVIKRMQKALADKGYYKGKIDGLFGNNTSKAIFSYQKSVKLEVTGLPDQKTLLLLFNPELTK